MERKREHAGEAEGKKRPCYFQWQGCCAPYHNSEARCFERVLCHYSYKDCNTYMILLGTLTWYTQQPDVLLSPIKNTFLRALTAAIC